MKKPLNDYFLKYPIAHRGLHSDNISENSLIAFKLAMDNDYAIELDIYRLKDGNFVIFHDKNLKRMTSIDDDITNYTAETLKELSLFDGQKIPTLEEVLKLIDGKIPILIELKPEGNFNKDDILPLLNIINKYNHPEKIAIQSFNPLTVKKIKKLTNKYSVGILSSYNLKNTSGIKKYILKSLLLYKYSKSDFISYDINFLPNKYVRKLRKNNKILAWVVDTKEKYDKAKNYSDNVIFENIEILKK